MVCTYFEWIIYFTSSGPSCAGYRFNNVKRDHVIAVSRANIERWITSIAQIFHNSETRNPKSFVSRGQIKSRKLTCISVIYWEVSTYRRQCSHCPVAVLPTSCVDSTSCQSVVNLLQQCQQLCDHTQIISLYSKKAVISLSKKWLPVQLNTVAILCHRASARKTWWLSISRELRLFCTMTQNGYCIVLHEI